MDGGRHVVVAVRDEGQRLGRRRESPNRGMGLGLPLITALTEAVEFTRRGARTEVRMTFRVDGAPPGRRARR